MKQPNRIVWLVYENMPAEVLTQQLHQAYVLYSIGGFEVREWVSDEDYREWEEHFMDYEGDE